MAESERTRLRLFREFQDRIPGQRGGTRCHLSTFIRWATQGVKMPDGTRLKLHAVRCGHKWLTTNEWFDAFTEAQTAAYQVDAPTRTDSQARRAAADADKRLAASGA